MKYVIEAGACDGVFKSTTDWTDEHYDDITAILIEPHPEMYDRLVQNRTKKNIFINKCLVGFDHPSTDIDLIQKNCVDQSSVMNIAEYNVPIDKQIPGVKIKCEASTLQKILDDLNIYEIEKLYLDVEGFEVEVLKGIDYEKTNIKEMEIEAHFMRTEFTKEEEFSAINQIISDYYDFCKEAKPNEEIKYIFKRK